MTLSEPQPPAHWESQHGFRETLLLYFPDREANGALRALGRLLFGLGVEHLGSSPAPDGGVTRAELRAALQDLRHLERFLDLVGEEHRTLALPPDEAALSRFARKAARALGKVAEMIDDKLAN